MFSVNVDTKYHGQERAYGPSVTTAILTYEGVTTRDLPSEDTVKRHAQALVCKFREGPSKTQDEYYMTKLASFARTDDGGDPLSATYELRLEAAFTD